MHKPVAYRNVEEERSLVTRSINLPVPPSRTADQVLRFEHANGGAWKWFTVEVWIDSPASTVRKRYGRMDRPGQAGTQRTEVFVVSSGGVENSMNSIRDTRIAHGYSEVPVDPAKTDRMQHRVLPQVRREYVRRDLIEPDTRQFAHVPEAVVRGHVPAAAPLGMTCQELVWLLACLQTRFTRGVSWSNTDPQLTALVANVVGTNYRDRRDRIEGICDMFCVMLRPDQYRRETTTDGIVWWHPVALAHAAHTMSTHDVLPAAAPRDSLVDW